MKILNNGVRVLTVSIMSLLSPLLSIAADILVPSFYFGTNRVSLDSGYEVMNPGWGGQLGLNVKAGVNWIQFDGSLELAVKGLTHKYEQTISAQSGRTLESKNSITSYGLHATLPLGVSIGYYEGDDMYSTNVSGVSIVGGGFIDLGIWGENRLKQDNRLSNHSNTLYEESNAYTQNCFGGNSLQRKRLDAGIYFGLAATTDIVGISIIYRKGLLNTSNIENLTYHNNGLFINLTINLSHEE